MGLIAKGHSEERKSNTYQLPEKVLVIIRAKKEEPVHHVDTTCPLNEHEPVHHVDTKEDSIKEYSFRENKDENSLNFISLKKNEKEDQKEKIEPHITEEKRKQNLELIREAQKKIIQQTSFAEPRSKSALRVGFEEVWLDTEKKAEIEKELEWTRQKYLERFNGKLHP